MARQRNGRRDAAIDVGRFVAIAAVVAIHTFDLSHYPAAGGSRMSDPWLSMDAGEVIDQLSRFAVPFFFTAAGYFLAARDLSDVRRVSWSIFSRIALCYVVWALLFNLAIPTGWPRSLHELGPFLVRLVLQGGAAPHLWFLPSLMLCMILLVLGLRVLPLSVLVALGLVLFATGLAAGPYRFAVLHHPASALQLHLVRDAPSFGFIFVAAGALLQRSGWRPRPSLALAILGIGAVLHLGEGLLMARAGLHRLSENDYLLGTLPFGIGAFLAALAWPRTLPLPPALAALGSCSLGLYAVHPAFVLALAPLLQDPVTLATRLGLWAGSLVGAIVIITQMTSWRPVRWLVQ